MVGQEFRRQPRGGKRLLCEDGLAGGSRESQGVTETESRWSQLALGWWKVSGKEWGEGMRKQRWGHTGEPKEIK